MKMTAFNWTDNRMFAKSENQKIINEFANSGLACVKLEGWLHRNATYCANSLRHTIKILHMEHIKAVVRKNEVYLIDTIMMMKK